jgi:cytochrome c oxidase accessory protein FixG
MGSQEKEIFRDSIGTIDDKGKRNFIFPKKPKGSFYNYRTIVSWILLTIMFAAPFIKIKGNQLFLFDIIERKFTIFGFPFWPQDFHLLVISVLVSFVFIILFTVVFGRIFCGWICPQTIFMEMVFRKIEYLIDGDRMKQIKLAKQSWNADKILKRISKWSIFYLISFLISNIFLAYIIGSDVVIGYITDGPATHQQTLIYLLIFSFVFYFIFGWFREQVCIVVCPYGRLQGVLLDDKSINVAYDFVRGEGENGRSKIRKGENREEEGIGDCIDCKQCVYVCPTGIDIRNGTQLECVNCTACIDECDAIMDKVGFDTGLIRYASEDNIERKLKFKITARLIGYSAILTILIGVMIAMIMLRNEIEATVYRLPGQTFQSTQTHIKNVYTIKLINKTTESFDDIEIKLLSHSGEVLIVGGQLLLDKQDLKEGTLFIEIAKKDLNSSKEKIKLGIYSGGEIIETTTTNFMGPVKFD